MDLKKISDDQILQAVIFAESYDAKFGPLTLSTPKVFPVFYENNQFLFTFFIIIF